MHDHQAYAYGAWGLVVTMVLISVFFIVRFIPMRTRLGKRSGGALIAFIVALFAEMYGFPLTIYLLSHFVGIRIPLDHISGHLLGDLITYLGLGNGWFIVMAVSNVLLIIGIWLVMAGWEQVYKSEGKLVTDGVYKHMRHPQYTGIFIITLGFMIQWPTLTTLILWPFVIAMYVRLAKREEQDVLKEFPDAYREYMQRTPMFFPRLLSRRDQQHGAPTEEAGKAS
ncbi:MAG: isoprenylcysteine carboxylmethyltransferase family protein [Planctomycetota bacterium]|nr:MAG: isoprenylcysteine carboxylmethyltransferase family protein [Planctomycetota bacterium]REJ92139.1 MAG: isoprenylcysteine carboxylmethyltransferase family protein [Planctomycetota bacterium]REK28675.1 MAG: isoprenylcysteine carboxylmethyltransferase family protein [Planctomycetota bacterium]REK39289.1 MAG: isoprenylcysteine carboxylmethyltransferase family protein [Planctomycetota bacterium]